LGHWPSSIWAFRSTPPQPWADSHGYLSPMAEMLVALTGGPAAVLTAWIFVRERHRTIARAEQAAAKTAQALQPAQ